MPDLPRLMTVEAVADKLNVHAETIRRLIRTGLHQDCPRTP